jgi:hypothetical protein
MRRRTGTCSRYHSGKEQNEWLVRVVIVIGIFNFAYRETNIKRERNDRYGS